MPRLGDPPAGVAGTVGGASPCHIYLDQGKQAMAKSESVFIYVGTYPDEASARDDYQIVKDLHSWGRSEPMAPPW